MKNFFKISIKFLLNFSKIFYLIISRTILAVLTLSLMTYFILNSSFLIERIEPILKTALPGQIQIEKIQIMPVPSHVRLHNVKIFTPENDEVVRANLIDVNIDLLKLLGSLFFNRNDMSVPLELTFKRIKLFNYQATLTFDENGDLLFLHAFVPKEEASDEKSGRSKSVKISFKEIFGKVGSALLDFPDFNMKYNGINMEVKMLIDKGGQLSLFVPELSVSEGSARIKAVNSLPPNIPFVYKSGKIYVKNYSLTNEEFKFALVDANFDHMRVVATNGGMGFPSEEKPLSFFGNAHVIIDEGEKNIEQMTMGLVQGKYEFDIYGNGDFENVNASLILTSPSLKVKDFLLNHVKLSMGYARDKMGD